MHFEASRVLSTIVTTGYGACSRQPTNSKVLLLPLKVGQWRRSASNSGRWRASGGGNVLLTSTMLLAVGSIAASYLAANYGAPVLQALSRLGNGIMHRLGLSETETQVAEFVPPVNHTNNALVTLSQPQAAPNPTPKFSPSLKPSKAKAENRIAIDQAQQRIVAALQSGIFPITLAADALEPIDAANTIKDIRRASTSPSKPISSNKASTHTSLAHRQECEIRLQENLIYHSLGFNPYPSFPYTLEKAQALKPGLTQSKHKKRRLVFCYAVTAAIYQELIYFKKLQQEKLHHAISNQQDIRFLGDFNPSQINTFKIAVLMRTQRIIHYFASTEVTVPDSTAKPSDEHHQHIEQIQYGIATAKPSYDAKSTIVLKDSNKKACLKFLKKHFLASLADDFNRINNKYNECYSKALTIYTGKDNPKFVEQQEVINEESDLDFYPSTLSI